MDGIKEFHKDGFIVFNTPIGDVTVALPDGTDQGFTLEVEEENDICQEIIFKFESQNDE